VRLYRGIKRDGPLKTTVQRLATDEDRIEDAKNKLQLCSDKACLGIVVRDLKSAYDKRTDIDSKDWYLLSALLDGTNPPVGDESIPEWNSGIVAAIGELGEHCERVFTRSFSK
jgi:hypothetical protein